MHYNYDFKIRVKFMKEISNVKIKKKFVLRSSMSCANINI